MDLASFCFKHYLEYYFSINQHFENMKVKSTTLFHFVISLLLLNACSGEIEKSKNLGSTTEKISDSNTLYAQQPPQQANQNLFNGRHNAITRAVKISSPAVVGINVTEIREIQYRNPLSLFWKNDPFFEHFMRPRNRVMRQEVKGLGSGFIISEDGYILTNSHVTGNATKIVVTTTDGRQFDAKLIGTDDLTDIALLKIDETDLPHLNFGNSDDLIVGEWAIAMGNPFGLFDINDKPSVTVGVISAIGLNFPDVDNRSYRDMIQTDAAINSGNSGGPLLNAYAEVIGMNTFIYTGGGKGSIGIGFAIPINRVKSIVEDLKAHGKIDRTFKTGITVQTINPKLAAVFGLEKAEGVVVAEIQRKSAGEKAGLKVGDIIVEANGDEIKDDQDLTFAVRELKADDYLNLKVIRDKKTLQIKVKLEK